MSHNDADSGKHTNKDGNYTDFVTSALPDHDPFSAVLMWIAFQFDDDNANPREGSDSFDAWQKGRIEGALDACSFAIRIRDLPADAAEREVVKVLQEAMYTMYKDAE